MMQVNKNSDPTLVDTLAREMMQVNQTGTYPCRYTGSRNDAGKSNWDPTLVDTLAREMMQVNQTGTLPL